MHRQEFKEKIKSLKRKGRENKRDMGLRLRKGNGGRHLLLLLFLFG